MDAHAREKHWVSEWSALEKVMTKLTLNCYKGSPYCNIRVYVGDAPSKQGVTLNVAEWSSIRNRLSNVPGSELHLAEKAYR